MRIGGPKQRSRVGFILYDGPSVLDGGPIFAAATFNTSNAKTGDLIQTWILRSDVHPLEASRSGADESICGSCPHRSLNGGRRSCYVNLIFGPRGVWEAYQEGKYEALDLKKHARFFRDQLMRVGAYGDPVAVPIEVWRPLVDLADRVTSYTHLWRLLAAEPFKEWTMASVDSVHEIDEAREAGWRCYRTDRGEGLQSDEIWCPATEPGGNKALCETCMLCDGNLRGNACKDIATPVHGSGSSHFKEWAEIRDLERQGFKQLEIFDG